jgi:tRNA(His) guanylyltransferase
MMSKDELGTRMKLYEGAETDARFMPRLPVIARLDGRAFHSWCKNLDRPYDSSMSALMVAVTKKLVEETNALVGYTQSDEITLAWYSDDPKSEIFFAGRKFKMISGLAAMASVYFNQMVPEYMPSKEGQLGFFDCRVWQVPNLSEAANVFVWRELDATKNSVSMAAQSMFSHQELQRKDGSAMQDMMMKTFNVNWNDYPPFFKRGTYVQRKEKVTKMDAADIELLPEKHHARLTPELAITRTVVTQIDMPIITTVQNRVDALFNGHTPIAGEYKE